MRHYCLGGCSAPSVCARRSRPVPGVVSPPFPPSRPACPALCVAGRPVRVSLILAPWYAISRGLCIPRARSGCPSGSPRVPLLCVRARALAVSAPPPPWVVWRAHLAWSRRWALVGPFHAVRAPPRVLTRSLAPLGVLGGGGPVPVPPYLAWGYAPPMGWVCAFGAFWCRGVGLGGGGGGPVRRAPRLYGRGGQWGGGSLCLVPSLCLPWAGNKAGVTGVVLVMEGVAPIPLRLVLACRLWAWFVRRPGALARVRVLPAVPVGAGNWGGGAGRAPAPLTGAAVPPGGGGTIASAPGGWGPALPRLAGRRGGGGGVAPRPPCSPFRGRPAVPYPAPPLVVGAFPPGVRVRSGSWGRPVHRVRPAWRGGGGGAARGPLPRGPLQTRTLPLPSPDGQFCGLHDALVLGGAAPILFRCAAARRPQASSARRSGALARARLSAATPAGAGAWGRWGARCAGPAASPPPPRGPFWGRGGVPSAPGGWGAGAPAALEPGGERGGGGRGGCSVAPRPPAPPGVGLPSISPGYTRAVGVAGRPWASGAARSAANGSVRRGGGGGGGQCRSVAGRAGA